MNRHNLLRALAMLVGVLGAISIVGVIAFEDIPPVQRVVTPINGLLLFVTAWLLLQRRHFASVLLAISAAVYFLSYAWPSVANNGPVGLTMFMPAFYLSVGGRLALAVVAYWLLKPRVSNA
jgi:hypothetical protein